ncbi:recombination mediator RecR [Patescibacteria group bacterium]|nr:recombination mediator RecR [Patescibacteria group bacterium]
MPTIPEPLKNLVDHFSRLPGVGPKTALRFVFYLLKQPKNEVEKFAAILGAIKNQMATCGICQNFSEKNPCAICGDSRRDHGTICVVAEYQDLPVIENTGIHNGTYHVLGGVLDPLHGITPDQLKIKALVGRIQNANGKIKEIILALNPDLEGETTMLYLTKLIKSFGKNIKITRLARGLPMGSDLEYADEVTVSDALKGRKEI